MGREIIPDAVVVANLTRLCQTVLQPLRDHIGRVIVVSSGYRPDWLNAAVGGSKASQHMTGQAADINAQGMTPFELCEAATRIGIPFDQVIHEFRRWCHISVPAYNAGPRGSILTAQKVEGRTVYINGLVP